MEELDEKIGNVRTAALLSFFLEEVGPSVYNKAVADVQGRLMARVGEVDIGLDRIARASDVHIVRHTRLRFGRG